MANAQIGMPTPAALRTIMDAMGRWLKYEYAGIGLGIGETTTSAAYALQAQSEILGDGAAVYGIDNAELKQSLVSILNDAPGMARYDRTAQMLWQRTVSGLGSFILTSKPASWDLTTGGLYALDALLVRMNCCHASTPLRPNQAKTPTLTGAAGGRIGAASTCRACFTYIGSRRYFESSPSVVSAQTALTGYQSAYTLGNLDATVPTGVTYIALYRQLTGAGAGDPYYWDSDVAVTAGAAFPTLTYSKSDLELNRSISPPSFAQALMGPEAAAVFALAYAAVPQALASQAGPMTLASAGILSARNCALAPANGYVGYMNAAADALFGQWASTTATYGTPRLTNDATNGLQGYGGAYGLQGRVTSILNNPIATSGLTVTYSYIDVDNLVTPVTGATANPAAGLAAAVGSTIDLAIPAGRIVTAVTAIAVGGASPPTTGTFVVEAKAVRSL